LSSCPNRAQIGPKSSLHRFRIKTG